MLNQATINNILNIGTLITRKPKQVYDPAERRARLVAQVDNVARRHGFTHAADINAFIRLSLVYLERGHSPASAYDKTRKSIQRTVLQLALHGITADTLSIV